MTRFRLRTTLVDSNPEIWRVFDIRGTLRLHELHDAMQTMMGWREAHLHAFTDADPYSFGAQGRRWESPDDPDVDGLSEEDFTVADALSGGGPLWYEYDFGDGWTHRIEIVERVLDDPHLAPVLMVDGAGRGPFEDSGGPHGYAEKVAIADDPRHPEHREITNWIEATVGPWAAETFDIIGIQSELNLRFNPDESGVSTSDLSGIVKDAAHRRPGDVHDASPLAALASELPPPIRAELRQHLHRTGVLEPTDLSPVSAAHIIRPFGWLMDAVGVAGLTLTDAGWMPGATVLAGMTELGWIDGWVGKGNREDVTPPIAVLRETAQRIGLVRVLKGRLVLTTAARRALGDPLLQLRLVATGLFRRLSDAETDAATLKLLAIADGTPPAERWKSVAFGLEACGWSSSSGWRFTATDIQHATFQADRVLMYIGDDYWRHGPQDEATHLVPFAREALR